MYRKVGALLLVALMLALASCGANEGKLTRAQMVQKAIAACEQQQAAIRAATRRTSPSAPDFQRRLAAAYLAGQRLLVSRLERLTPPDAEYRDFTVFRQAQRRKLVALEKLNATANSTAFERVIEAERAEQQVVFEQVHAVWKRYRLGACV